MPDNLKGHWPKVAIGGLVLVNAVLMSMLGVAERSRSLTAQPVLAGEPSASLSTSSATRPTPTAAPSSTLPEATPSGTGSPSESAAPPSRTLSPGSGSTPRLLAVNSATLAWRALAGRCPTDPQVEVTRDGGRTWRPTDAGLRSVSRMRSYDESSVFAVGGDEDCDPRYATTGGPGESWTDSARLLGQTWYRMPSDINKIHAPGGRLSSPCETRLDDFAGLGDGGAAAICTDGSVRLTQDGGQQWRDLEGVAKGRSVGADEEVYVLALRRAQCTPGVGVALLTPGTREVDSEAVRCAPVGGDPDTELAVSVRGQVLWLWAGEEVAVSTDRGRNWELA